MKTLYLVRHAKSSWEYPDLEDFERPLNKRGRKSAQIMGEVLYRLKTAPDLLLSSPATRAAMTARVIAGKIRYPLDGILYTEALYLAEGKALLEIVRKTDPGVNQAMLIGHNPGLTELADHLGDRRIGNIPTCGVCCIDLEIPSWAEVAEHCGKMRFFESPRKNAS
jgi:phosphohistidine phosphatase